MKYIYKLISLNFLLISLIFCSNLLSRGIYFKNESGWRVKITTGRAGMGYKEGNIKNGRTWRYDYTANPKSIHIIPKCAYGAWDASREILITSKIIARLGEGYSTVTIKREDIPYGRIRLSVKVDSGDIRGGRLETQHNNEWATGK